MAAAIALPGDERVVEALARLGMATVSVIGPGDLRERLGGELAGDTARLAAAEIDALAVLLARG